MKRITLAFFAASLLFAACSNEKSEGETKDASGETKKEESTAKKEEKKAWVPITTEMMNKAWAESMTPGEEHKMLAKSSGKWNAEVTNWMAIDSPAIKSTGTAVNTMILNGLYQESKFSGNMMGFPLNGVATVGYDKAAKEYVSTWIDNMGSSMMIMRGKWDDSKKAIELTGTMKNAANGTDCNIREVFKPIDDNTEVMELYGPDPMTGKEFKMMEIKYTRKK